MWNENDGKLDGTEAGRDAWRDQFIKRVTWNCYNYAVNKKTFKNGDPVRAHPGKGNEWPNIGKTLTAQQWCDKVKALRQAGRTQEHRLGTRAGHSYTI